MTRLVGMGVPGVTLEAGDHVCAFYFGTEDRDKVLIPFLRAGLSAGEKCIAVVDEPGSPEMLARIDDGFELDVQAFVTSQQLVLQQSADTYLRTGMFSTAEMLDYYEQFVSTAIDAGYPFARVTGEAGWVLSEPPGADEFIDYESALNDFAPRYPQVVMCLYDLELFGGGMMLDVLKTHKKVLLGGLVFENPHYLSPDEFRATKL